MKKQRFIFIFWLLMSNIACAQLENKGWWTRDLFTYQFYQQDASLADNRLERHYNRVFTQPELGYVLNKRVLVGIVAQFERVTDRYDVPADRSSLRASTKRSYGAGPLFRYYFPLTKRASFMPEVYGFLSRETNTEIYSDFGVDRKTSNSRNILGLGANPTIVYFLTRDMAFSITVVNIGYYANKGSQSFTFSLNPQQWLFGVEFYFEKKKTKTPP